MTLYMRFQRRLLGGRELSPFLVPLLSALAAACLVLCGGLQQAWASTATTTTLAIASGGNKVTTLASGSVITLTAIVKVGGTAVRPGQVNFCDATAAYCTDIHLLGAAQLTTRVGRRC
jgi:trimeric autotransporter adhesin